MSSCPLYRVAAEIPDPSYVFPLLTQDFGSSAEIRRGEKLG